MLRSTVQPGKTPVSTFREVVCTVHLVVIQQFNVLTTTKDNNSHGLISFAKHIQWQLKQEHGLVCFSVDYNLTAVHFTNTPTG